MWGNMGVRMCVSVYACMGAFIRVWACTRVWACVYLCIHYPLSMICVHDLRTCGCYLLRSTFIGIALAQLSYSVYLYCTYRSTCLSTLPIYQSMFLCVLNTFKDATCVI